MTQPVPKPIKPRIVLWSFLAMVVFLGASVFCYAVAFGPNGSSTWANAGIVLGMLAALAIAAFIVSVIIRIVEFFNRRAQRRIEVGDTFE